MQQGLTNVDEHTCIDCSVSCLTRPVQAEWVRTIRDKCLAKQVPFFSKQWGGFHKNEAGRTLDGRTWDQMPLPAGDLPEDRN